MPLFVYRCTRCEREVEELQKHDDPPPVSDDPCTSATPTEPACDLQRVISMGHHRFKPELSSAGLGGWEQQGEAMVRRHRGAGMHRYGDSSTGRD